MLVDLASRGLIYIYNLHIYMLMRDAKGGKIENMLMRDAKGGKKETRKVL